MLLAIDIGNTHTVVGVWKDESWLAVWRRSTNPESTEDELASWLHGLIKLSDIDFRPYAAICASVVPSSNNAVERLCEKWFGIKACFLTASSDLGLIVRYDPPTAVGADRLANALGALAKYEPPIVVVDFGTATTFDAIAGDGAYVGGAILPGVDISSKALFERAAKLPPVEFVAPERALGRNTVESLQSGIVLGYAGAIDTLAGRISHELGGAKHIVATGGLGRLFVGVCGSLQAYEPNLTLDGLLIAHNRLKGH